MTGTILWEGVNQCLLPQISSELLTIVNKQLLKEFPSANQLPKIGAITDLRQIRLWESGNMLAKDAKFMKKVA